MDYRIQIFCIVLLVVVLLGSLVYGLSLCGAGDSEVRLENKAKREAHCTSYCKDRGGVSYAEILSGRRYRCVCMDEGMGVY